MVKLQLRVFKTKTTRRAIDAKAETIDSDQLVVSPFMANCYFTETFAVQVGF